MAIYAPTANLPKGLYAAIWAEMEAGQQVIVFVGPYTCQEDMNSDRRKVIDVAKIYGGVDYEPVRR